VADDADRAQDITEAAMAAWRPVHKYTAPTGECQNPACLNEFPQGDTRLYCDRECADKGAHYGKR
jgi:hypothetical protein